MDAVEVAVHLGPEVTGLVAAARADFLERGAAQGAGVRELVVASWRRSRSAGVDADAYRIRYHEDVDLDSRLVRCARPVIDRLADEMVDVPVAIALSDAQARIVHRLDCSTSVGRQLDRVDFTAGFDFGEGGVGTNGIGTVFETGASVSVVGAEHFTEALVRFACTGAPVVDPVTGRVEGVLDVSSLAETWTPLMHTLVRRAAADIGRNLLLDRGQAKRALFDAFLRADARPRQAVMAVGDSLMVNRRAQQLCSPAEQVAVHQHALFLMGRRDRVVDSFVLGSGRTVRLRATRVRVGEEVAGIVLLLDEGPSRPRPPVGWTGDRAPLVSRTVGPTPPPPVPGGRSPAWLAACAQVESGLGRGDRLLVLGEPGTGRRTLLLDLFGRLHPAGAVVAGEVDQLLGDGVPTDGDGPALVVLRHLDRIASDTAERLAALLASLDRHRYVVAATLDDARTDADLPFRTVLGEFEQAVRVPPLRHRTDDLPLVVARLLAELAPDRLVRLHPETSRLIGRHPWPGNLVQLRAALAGALQRRPVGELRPDDLPAWCRAGGSSRTLTPLESAERDAIVTALQECRGNRVRAAASLGMARSSLYRKMRSYSITDA